MKNFSTIWYKDKTSRLVYLVTWILLLFMLNYSVVLLIKDSLEIWQFVLSLFVWFLFYRLYVLFKYIRYEFSEKWINIYQNKNKSYFLKIEDIEKIEKINKLNFFSWFWVKYNYFTKEVYFTTSLSKILKIYLKDWRVVLITPKTFDDAFLNLIK